MASGRRRKRLTGHKADCDELDARRNPGPILVLTSYALKAGRRLGNLRRPDTHRWNNGFLGRTRFQYRAPLAACPGRTSIGWSSSPCWAVYWGAESRRDRPPAACRSRADHSGE